MSTLTGNKIKDTYTGLLKTSDNAPVSATLKAVEDGAGNAVPIQISTTEVAFTGAVDFSTAAVSGLPEPGLVNGVGTNSVKSSDSLTTSASQTNGNSSIALGNGAKANGSESVAIGDFAEASQIGCAAVGQYAEASATYASAWGRTSYARADGSVAFGQQAGVPFTAPGGVAIGRQVVADLSDTTHVRALKIVAPDGGTGGNGITMLSPNGTAGVITLTDASELAVDGTPIGGGGAAGLVAGTATSDSIKSADSLSTNPNTASATNTIAIGNGAFVDVVDSIVLGQALNNSGQGSTIMIGKNWSQGFGRRGVFIGTNTVSQSVGQDDMIVIGNNTSGFVFESNGGVAIGNQTQIYGSSNGFGIAIGYGAVSGINALTDRNVAIGYNALANATVGAVALGPGVTASKDNTATVNELEVAAVGGGVILYSPNGTGYKLTVSDAGALTVTAI